MKKLTLRRNVKYPENYCCVCGKKIENGISSSKLGVGWCSEHSMGYKKVK